MRFQVLDILPYLLNPVTGRHPSPAARLTQSMQMAQFAERVGVDAYAFGERHARHVLSPAAGVLLGAVAATTARIRLQTGVCVLPILDPVRVAEDFATVDQLSRGRFELVIGKGNEARQLPMFGVRKEDQDQLLAEKYELLRVLWREEDVTWSGGFRPPLETTLCGHEGLDGTPRTP